MELDISCATKVKSMNVSNIRRIALRNEIDDPLSLSLEQLLVRSKVCKEHCRRLMAEAP